MNLPEEKRCPNCQGELAWIVTRKRVCPSCRKPIYLEFNPVDDRKYAVTADEAKAFKEVQSELLRQNFSELDLQETETRPPEEVATKLLSEGGKWWEFRDVAQILIKERKASLAWTCFNQALAEANKIGRTCETIYPYMGRQALREGRSREGFTMLLLAVSEYGRWEKKWPCAAERLDLPKYLLQDIKRAANALGLPQDQLQELMVLARTKGVDSMTEKLRTLQPEAANVA